MWFLCCMPNQAKSKPFCSRQKLLNLCALIGWHKKTTGQKLPTKLLSSNFFLRQPIDLTTDPGPFIKSLPTSFWQNYPDLTWSWWFLLVGIGAARRCVSASTTSTQPSGSPAASISFNSISGMLKPFLGLCSFKVAISWNSRQNVLKKNQIGTCLNSNSIKEFRIWIRYRWNIG
jgi:hypothetical protein